MQAEPLVKSLVTPRPSDSPNLGLVCITIGDQVRYRTITRKRLLQFTEPEQQEILRELYQSNIERLQGALQFCADHSIHLYRFPTNLFPFADTPLGAAVLSEFSDSLRQVGQRSTQAGIRLLVHPEQFIFCVSSWIQLNSEMVSSFAVPLSGGAMAAESTVAST
jgi:UV DNA damage repair endonuclease